MAGYAISTPDYRRQLALDYSIRSNPGASSEYVLDQAEKFFQFMTKGSSVENN